MKPPSIDAPLSEQLDFIAEMLRRDDDFGEGEFLLAAIRPRLEAAAALTHSVSFPGGTGGHDRFSAVSGGVAGGHGGDYCRIDLCARSPGLTQIGDWRCGDTGVVRYAEHSLHPEWRVSIANGGALCSQAGGIEIPPEVFAWLIGPIVKSYRGP